MEQTLQQKNKIMAGIDIEPESVQISWFGGKLTEPETVGMQVGIDKFKIPLCLFYRENEKDYQFGQAALDCNRNEEKGVFIPSLYSDCLNNRKIRIEKETVSAVKLLQIFLEKLVHMVEMISGTQSILAIAFAAKDMDEKLISVLQEASEIFYSKGTRIFFKSYEESYISYLMNGPSEFYARDSVLFYFRKGCLDIYHVVINKKFKPYTVKLQKESIDGFEAVDEALFCSDEEKEQLDAHFLDTVKKLFGRALVSSVFLTGDGFDQEWMKGSLRFLCQGRRVFQGKNLFTKGACHILMEELSHSRKYRFDGPNRFPYRLQIPMWQDGNKNPYEVYDGGGDWYEVQESFNCLLDDCHEIKVEIAEQDELSEKRTEVLELDDLPNRPALATKLQVDIIATAKDRLKITAKDLGLGEFFESTGKVWDKEIIL